MDIQSAFLLAGATFYGACFGSFANVVAWRDGTGQGWVQRVKQLGGRSACPGCHRKLCWWELAPVAGWVVLRGRCRGCRMAISPVYPTTELLTAMASGAAVALLGLSWWLLPALVAIWLAAPWLSKALFALSIRRGARRSGS